VVKIVGVDSATLREHGWLFDIAGEDTRFWTFWTVRRLFPGLI